MHRKTRPENSTANAADQKTMNIETDDLQLSGQRLLPASACSTIKAISLWQPWASLMAIEAKRNETRGKPWKYQGDVAIHAAKLYWRENVPEYAITALTWLW